MSSGGFKKFLLRGNVVDMAVGIVVGAAFESVVSTFVSSFITPLIAAIGGKSDFSSLYFTLNGSKFYYGKFVDALLAFIIVAAVVYYFIVLPLGGLVAKALADEHKTERDCPHCLSEVPREAHRCKFCTSELQPV